MLDVLEVQDQLKNFSQEQLLREMQMPTGNVPQFLVLSELNRRRTMSQDLAKRQSADQPTVKEEVVASSGMPMEKASMMAQQMAPKTSMTENTGIASMMPRELPSEEEPMKMSFGGLLMGSRMLNQMAAPLASRITPRPGLDREVTDMEYRPNRFPFPAMQGRFSSGLDNLGRDISGRVQNRTQEEVQDFIGEVDNMAQERFEVNLSEPSQRQRDMQSFLSGKGQPPRAVAMKDGGVIKAQSGMFAQMMPKFPTPPAFATIYNYAKTVLGLDDELARDVANKTIQQGEIDKSQLGLFSAKPFGSVEERLSGDDRLAQRKALDTFTGGEEMNQLVDQLSQPTTDIGGVQDVQDVDPLRLDIQNRLAESKKPKTANMFRGLSGEYDAINEKLQEANQALDNFTGGAEMSDLVDRLDTQQVDASEGSKSRRGSRNTKSQTFSQFMRRNFPITAENIGFGEEDASGVTRKQYEDIFKFGRSDPSRPFMSGTDLERYKEIFKDGRTSPFEVEEQKNKQTMDNFTGGEEMDKLVDKIEQEQEQEEKKKKKDEKGGAEELGDLGGFGKASGALSDLSAQIAELKEKREKGRESEKWFSLAKLGLGMLASANPTVFGALGEGGLKALEDFKAGKKAYDDDILGYLKTQASIAKSQAELGVKGLVARKQLELAKKKGTGTYCVKEIFDDIAKIDERLQGFADPTKFGIKDEDTIKEINRLKTRRLQLSNLLPAGLRPIEVDLATTASTS